MSVNVRALIMMTASGDSKEVVLDKDSVSTSHAEFIFLPVCAKLALMGTNNIVSSDSTSRPDCLVAAQGVVAAKLGTDWTVEYSSAGDYSQPRSRWNEGTQSWDPPGAGDIQHAWRLAYQGNTLLASSGGLKSPLNLNASAYLNARIMIQSE